MCGTIQKQGKVFREFIGKLMNAKADYDNKVERNNTSDSISEVISEESNDLNTIKR